MKQKVLFLVLASTMMFGCSKSVRTHSTPPAENTEIQKEQNTIENNFLGYFRLGMSKSEFAEACNEFHSQRVSEGGIFVVDSIPYSYWDTDYTSASRYENHEMTESHVRSLYDYHYFPKYIFFYKDKLICWGFRTSHFNPFTVDYFETKDGYEFNEEQLNGALGIADYVLPKSLDKKYGRHRTLSKTIDDIRCFFETELTSNRLFDSNFFATDEWSDKNITIQTGIICYPCKTRKEIAVYGLILFFDNKIFNEKYLRRKFGIDSNISKIVNTEW